MDYQKDFKGWVELKERLHTSQHTLPLFKEGEIWWCHIGENIGREANGKGVSFTRPVLILRKYNSCQFFGLSVTTKPKNDVWHETVALGIGIRSIALSQGRVFDVLRLDKRLTELPSSVFKTLKEHFLRLHT